MTPRGRGGWILCFVVVGLAGHGFLLLDEACGQPVYQTGWPYHHSPRQPRPALPYDINGDGLPELFVPTHALDFHAFDAAAGVVATWNYPYLSGGPLIRIGDFDGDGTLEVLVAGNSTLIGAFNDLAGNPLPWPQVSPEASSPSGFFHTFIVADLDLDGTLEIICNGDHFGHQNDKIHVLDHQGNSLPGWPKVYLDKDVRVAVEDLDGDGSKEIVVASRHACFCNQPSPTYVYRADGSLYPGWPVTPTGGIHPYLWWPVIADLDGDGLREVIGASDYDLYFLRQDGSQFRPPRYIGEILRELAVADLDSDGRKEIIVPGLELRVVDYDAGVVAITTGYGYQGYDGISVADLDGDGFAEIGAFNVWPPAVHLFDRHLVPHPGWPVDVDPSLHSQQNKTLMVDLDGDGDLEFIYAKTYHTHVYDLPNATGNPPRVLWQGWYNDVNAASSYHVREPPLGQRFVRCDSNDSGSFNLADIVHTAWLLFVAQRMPACLDASDCNDDGTVNLLDLITGLGALFGAEPMPPKGCRVNVTGSSLGCDVHLSCP